MSVSTRVGSRLAQPWSAEAYSTGKSSCSSVAPSLSNRSKVWSTTQPGREPGRSILFTTTMALWPSPRALRVTKRVCGIGPSTASTRISTPSTIDRTRSTSPPKSAWPGVSTMLMRVPPLWMAKFFGRMVIPRSRSMSLESITRSAIFSWEAKVPDCLSRQSTRVVLPWSTWAMMAMLRIGRCMGTWDRKVARAKKAEQGTRRDLPRLNLCQHASYYAKLAKISRFVYISKMAEMGVKMDSAVLALKGLAEPTRLRLLALLGHGELTVGEVSRVLGQSQPRVSRHLRLLTEAGFLDRFREQKCVYYRTPATGARSVWVRELLASIDADDPALRRDRVRLTNVIGDPGRAAAGELAGETTPAAEDAGPGALPRQEPGPLAVGEPLRIRTGSRSPVRN